jgi:hypothetical protein
MYHLFQLLLGNFTSSIVPCFCGLAVGALYNNVNALKQWRFPRWVRSFTSKYILPILATGSRTKYQPPRNAAASSTMPRSPPPPPPVKNEDIETMFAMFPNYSRQDIKTALTKSKSDLNRAAEILLSSEPSTGSSGSQ